MGDAGAPSPLFSMPFPALWGKESPKENFVFFGSLGGLEPIRKGSEFFATFFQKKLRRGLFLAEGYTGEGEC